MSRSLFGAAARGIGGIRVGDSPLPGQVYLIDGLGKLAGMTGGDNAVVSPWPGVRFQVDLADRIQRQMWAGTYEPHVRACIDALLEAGNVYFDVGSHIGYHAVAAAHRVGPDGRVCAFEPDPILYQRLLRNLQQFRWAQAKDAAVWEKTGSLTFVRSSNARESGWGSLSSVRNVGEGDRVEVETVSLDDWCREAHIVRWDMMKLDAEGSELAVLTGAQNSLDEFQPVMIIEINGPILKQAGSSSAQVADFLTQRNYRLYHVSYRRLEPWDIAKHELFSDTLCVPSARATPVLEQLKPSGFKIA